MSEDLKSVYSRAPEIFQKLRREIDKVMVGQNVALMVLGTGVGIGVVGSYVSVRSYLKR